MKSVNKVTLIGHLGKDPEMKFTQGGMPVAKFTLATNERQKDKDGQWQDRTEWHNLVAFQRTAEIVGEYLKKGRQVYIEGSLRTGSWDDKETGKKMYKTDILVNDLVLLGGGRGEGGGGGQTGGARGVSTASAGGNNFDQSAPEPEHAPAGSSPITDEDIPF
jgi:single-strand DNA-binding protein